MTGSVRAPRDRRVGAVTIDAPARAAARRRTPVWRPALCLVLAVGAGVAAWLMVRQGVTVNEFPPFLPDGVPTEITRYSGPWLAGAGAAAVVAAVLLVVAGSDMLGARSGRAADAARPTGRSGSPSAGWAAPAGDGHGPGAAPGTLAE